MISGARTWNELRVDASNERFAELLVAGVAPFLRGRVAGEPRHGHFVADPDTDAISVYLEGSEDPDDERAALLQFLRERGLGPCVSGISVFRGARTTVHATQISGTAAQDLIDDFLVETTPFAISLIESTAARPAARAAVAFDLMVAQPLALKVTLFERLRSLPYPLAFVSYRSHVDGFFVTSKDPLATKRAFEERYARTAERLHGRMQAVIAQVEGEMAFITRPVQDWLRFAARYVERVRAGLCAGTLVAAEEETDGYIGDNFDLSVSPFHQVIQADATLRALATRDPDFNTMRIMVSLLYLTLHRIGLRLAERYMLCYSAARTFETRYGLSPAKTISLFAEILYDRPAAMEPSCANHPLVETER